MYIIAKEGKPILLGDHAAPLNFRFLSWGMQIAKESAEL